MTQTVLPSGRTSDVGYDAAGRVLQVSHSDGTGASFEYDARGQLLRALNESADVRLERDALGRIVAESQDGGQTWVRSRYGAGGERASLRSDLGARQDVEVDAFGDVAALIHGGGVPGSGAPARIGFERNAAGLEVARELPGGVRVAWMREKLGRPLERQTTRRRGPGGTASEVLDARSYQWRGADQIGAIIDAATGPRLYDHDRRGRLIRERRPDATIERAMDAVGNVYRRSDRGDRRYGAGGRIEEADGTRYEYDADGNQTLRVEPDGSRWTYRWNGAGMLTEVVRPDGRRVRFGYDAFARRTSKQVLTDAGDAETIESETRFVWHENNVLHELGSEAPPTTWYWEPDTFTPVMKRQGDAWHSVASDHLGTPTEMYDELGELAWSMQLDVFGVPRIGVGEAGDCPWRWPGQYEDGATGLAQSRFRYYSASEGRFISADPTGLLGGLHAYAYPSNPTSWLDPFGLSARQLAADMRRNGRPLVPGQTAHHIVHENSTNIWSQRSRELLTRNGIDIDGEANGVRLWGTADSQVARPQHPGREAARAAGTYHAGNHIHTHGGVDDAARMTYRTLQEAEARGNVEDVLRDIGRRMEGGSWRSTYAVMGGRCS